METNSLIDLANEICGCDVMAGGRHPEAVLARALITDALSREGYTEMQIGEILKRDHSSINHLKWWLKDLSVSRAWRKWEWKAYVEFRTRTSM